MMVIMLRLKKEVYSSVSNDINAMAIPGRDSGRR